MAFNPALPADHSPLSSAEMRSQLNALNDQLAALQAQLAPLVPQLIRDATGHWTVAYAGPAQVYWTVWVRWDGNGVWTNSGEFETTDFPVQDGDMIPADAPLWWQVKLCGEGAGDAKEHTAFSNIISFGPVPDA